VTSGATPSAGINVAVASTARIYDFWLGGKDNSAARVVYVDIDDGFGLVGPGLVQVPYWRPEEVVPDARKVWFLGGVGRKPGLPNGREVTPA
jgi:hypothetical protein